jgi:hypothetical protein
VYSKRPKTLSIILENLKTVLKLQIAVVLTMCHSTSAVRMKRSGFHASECGSADSLCPVLTASLHPGTTHLNYA